MSDEKLDLILSVVSGIKVRQEGLEKTVDGIVVQIAGLETRFDGLEAKVDNLDSEFRSFKQQVSESFIFVNNRLTLLEKQMLAIGVEIKAEIKMEIRAVSAKIERLEKQVIYDRTETLEHKTELREIDDRLTKIENHIAI